MDLPTFQASICVNHPIQIDRRCTIPLIESVARSPSQHFGNVSTEAPVQFADKYSDYSIKRVL